MYVVYHVLLILLTVSKKISKKDYLCISSKFNSSEKSIKIGRGEIG